MIVSKPKFSTIFSLSAFLLIAYGLGLWSYLTLPSSGDVSTWRYILTGTIFAIALLVTIKILWSYQVLRLEREHWKITRLLRSNTAFKTSDIAWWKITVIDTKGGKYQELQVQSTLGTTVKISPQEHTEYPRVLSHVQKKCPKKKVQTD